MRRREEKRERERDDVLDNVLEGVRGDVDELIVLVKKQPCK